MAHAALDTLRLRPAAALVAGPRETGAPPLAVEHIDAEHPLPGSDSVRAGRRALEIAARARDAGATLLVLLSGGASAMLSAPAPGLSLRHKREVTDSLLRAGADIAQVNAVRKHLSAVKGGRLGAAAGRTVTLALSDVHDPPDDPATIASGPTVADPTTYADALDVLIRYGIEPPHAVAAHLASGRDGAVPETPKPGDPSLVDSMFAVIANRRTAANAAATEARRVGYLVHVVDQPTRGEARDAGRRFAEFALATRPPAGPVCVIGSGEPTVTVRGSGRGGRNQEFVLGAGPVLAGCAQPAVLASIGTDGIDGPTDAAGGVVSSDTMTRAATMGLAVNAALARNDAYRVLAALDDLIRWGPTFTNVGDLHILITMGA